MFPTYKQQFDKMTISYIEDKVEPFISSCCFVGNLLSDGDAWAFFRDIIEPDNNGKVLLSKVLESKRNKCKQYLSSLRVKYTPDDIFDLESTFLYFINIKTQQGLEYEDALFFSFEQTLEQLKRIHIRLGEEIEETTIFNKRILEIN